jgi:hypothetical protein
MYSHQHLQQQQQHQQHHQQPQYQVMDTAPYNNSIPSYLPPPNTSTSIHNYNQQQQQRPPPPPPPHHQQYNHQHHNMIISQPPPIPPPEPTPSATDALPTPPLSITQLADFASTMVYLMWHARRPSVMALHDHSKFTMQQQSGSSTEDHHLGHSRETANIANRTSTAFKKFCKQVKKAESKRVFYLYLIAKLCLIVDFNCNTVV